MNPKKSRGATEKSTRSNLILTDASPKLQDFQPKKPEDELIERLLNGWEKLFLQEIKKTKTLGPKQQQKLGQIAARRLEGEL